MKVSIYQNPPPGFEAKPEIKIFSPIDDPSVCVMAQLYSESKLIVNPAEVWVVVPTERVEKIKFVSNPAPAPKANEQIQNPHFRRPGHD
jgi:hypothetical protein